MSDCDQRLATVMVVDSDEGELSLLGSILRLKGFDVLTAGNARDAVDLATRWRPEMILIELKLPITGGFGAIRSIRELSTLRETPIIACSLNKPTFHHSLALAAGCVAHLEKPIDFNQLDALLDQYLPGRRWELVSLLVH